MADRVKVIVEFDVPSLDDQDWVAPDNYIYMIAAEVGPRLEELMPTSPMVNVYLQGRKREGVWVNGQGDIGRL